MDAHKVVDYLKEHFSQSDMEIVLLLSQGTLTMSLLQKEMMKKGIPDIPGFDEYLMHKLDKLDKIDVYLTDVIMEDWPV